MVTIDQVEKGIAEYLDKELMPILPETGFQKILIGTGISLIIRKNKDKIAAMQDNSVVKMTGIFDEEGNVDIDVLKEEVSKQMPKEGVKIDVPVIGGLTFHKSDVEKLYGYITGMTKTALQ